MKIKVDLHIHSTYSEDSQLTIDEIVRFYFENGFKAIAITDHETFKGAIRARKLVKSLGIDLVVILGMEIETSEGELIILTDQELVEIPRKADKLIRKVKEIGGITYAPHPFDPNRKSLGEELYNLHDIDAIEVINANSNKKYNRLAHRAMKILGKPGLANSDAHTIKKMGTAYTIIEVEEINVGNILKSIRKGRIIKRILKKFKNNRKI